MYYLFRSLKDRTLLTQFFKIPNQGAMKAAVIHMPKNVNFFFEKTEYAIKS